MLLASVCLLMSYSIDPPNGKTGAPGDSYCTECHVQPSASIQGTFSVEGFPSAITPGQVYPLTVVVRDTSGNGVRAGFQLTILGPTNTKAGTLASPSQSSAIANASGRQYFEHRPAVAFPDSNVVRWTVAWTAPELASGSTVTFFAAGNIANGNFQNTGDRVLSSTGSGTVVVSSIDDITSIKPTLYPNPGTNELHLTTSTSEKPDGTIHFFNSTGSLVGTAPCIQGDVDVPSIPPGVYWTEIQLGSDSFFSKWVKM